MSGLTEVSEVRLFSLQTQDFPSPLRSLFHLNVIKYSIFFWRLYFPHLHCNYFVLSYCTPSIYFGPFNISFLVCFFFHPCFFPTISLSFFASVPCSFHFFFHFKCNPSVARPVVQCVAGSRNATQRMIDDDNDNDDEEGQSTHPGNHNAFPRYSYSAITITVTTQSFFFCIYNCVLKRTHINTACRTNWTHM